MRLGAHRFVAVRERARESFWIVPLLGVLVSVALGATLPRLELRVEALQMPWLFDGGPDAARSVLSTVAGSMITVTSLTFSLTVVTLQLASSQFSPRLLRSFLRDLRNQAVLSLLLSTFVFSLLVMLTVRTQNDRGPGFVPELSVSLTMVLVVASVMALVWFIGHVVAVVRVGRIMDDVASESLALLQRETDQLVPGGACDPAPPAVVGRPVTSTRSGFVQRVDVPAVGRWASEREAVVHLSSSPGSWIFRGMPWAYVEGSDDDAVGAALTLGAERTAQQDVGFGIRQLVDIALRALSPGINDPTTAIDAVGHIGDVLIVMSQRRLGARTWVDDDGVARVHLAGPSLAQHLELACGQIRRAAADLPEVMVALIDVLAALGAACDDVTRREAVLRELAAIDVATDRDITGVRERLDVRDRLTAARAALGLPVD